MAEIVTRVVAGALGALLVAALARRRRSLTRDGAIAAVVVGTIVVGAGGWWWGTLLIVFFVSSSALSLARAAPAGLPPRRGHERDAVQVAANGGVATAIAASGLIGAGGFEPVRFALFCGAIAAVNADTWATEIGRFSRTPPRLLTTGVPVAAGTSGGVTPLGTGGSILGALLIAVVAALGSGLGWVAAPAPWLLLVGTMAAGLAGSLLDSLLGATLQASYRERQTGRLTERRTDVAGNPTELVRGYHWITNDTVNLAASLAGAVVAGVIVLKS